MSVCCHQLVTVFQCRLLFYFLRLLKSTFCHKISKCLGLYRFPWSKFQAVFAKLDAQFDHPIRDSHPLQNLFKRLISQHSDIMTLKVLSQFFRGHQQRVGQLLNLTVVELRIMDGFTDIVNRELIEVSLINTVAKVSSNVAKQR